MYKFIYHYIAIPVVKLLLVRVFFLSPPPLLSKKIHLVWVWRKLETPHNLVETMNEQPQLQPTSKKRVAFSYSIEPLYSLFLINVFILRFTGYLRCNFSVVFTLL